jgi:hypothetical protein
MQQVIKRARMLKYLSSAGMSGYIVETSIVSAPGSEVQPSAPSAIRQGMEPNGDTVQMRQPLSHYVVLKIVHIQQVIRIIPLAVRFTSLSQASLPRSAKPAQQGTRQTSTLNPVILRPMRSGKSYRIVSSPKRGLVRLELAEALEEVLEQFAKQQRFSSEKPLELSLSRGYKANSHGHKEGRAADIDAVGGKSLLQWKQEWDQATTSAQKLDDPNQRAEAIAAEQRRNLGYGLYKALQAHGGWRVNPVGWRVYRNEMQLFGPWTATEGPWKAMQLENPTPEERQRLADQKWVFQAHQDHIHVAL